MTVQRLFVAVGSGQLHYRRAGEGPPVVLLHRLARNFTVVAVDTPGYGLSDPLAGAASAQRVPALSDYVPALRCACLIQRATRRTPNSTRCSRAIFRTSRRAATVVISITHWDMVRSLNLFAPWGRQRPRHNGCRSTCPSRVRVPATLMRWEGKPDLAKVDELIGSGLPADFTVLRAGPSMDERLAVNEQHLLTHYLPTGVTPPPPVPQLRPRLGSRPLCAVDLPGCGESIWLDGVPGHTDLFAIWARQVIDVLERLQWREVDVLGIGMGAQLALELARRVAGTELRIPRIATIELPHIEASARECWRRGLAASLEPRWHGGHLATAWSIARDAALFRPWFERSRGAARADEALLGAEVVHARAVDLLKAWESWPVMAEGVTKLAGALSKTRLVPLVALLLPA